MSLIHFDSTSCTKSELDLSSLPATQTVIEQNKYIEIRPVTSISQNSAIDFVIPASTDEVLDLNSTRLKVKLKIIKGTGGNYNEASTTDKIGPVNYTLGSLFSQVDVSFGEKLVSSSNQTYPYLAYIETLLSHNTNVKKNYLGMTGFVEEEDATENFKKRTKLTKTSQELNLYGPLHNDIFKSCRALLPGVDVRIRLTPSKPEFVIQCAAATGAGAELVDPSASHPKVAISDISLYALKLKPSPGALLAQNQFLASNNAKYPIVRSNIKTFTITNGQSSSNIANLYMGNLPNRIFIAFVPHVAFNGSYTTNPFEFKNFKINYIALNVNGQQYPIKPYTPDFENGDYVREFEALYNVLGSENCDISYDAFKKTSCVFAFDLTADLSTSQNLYWNLSQSGNIGLEVRFKEALDAAITLISYSQKHSVIEIDLYRNILLESL